METWWSNLRTCGQDSWTGRYILRRSNIFREIAIFLWKLYTQLARFVLQVLYFYRVVFISFPSAFCSVYVHPRRKSYFINHCFFLTRSEFSINNFFLYEQLFINEVVANPLLIRGSFIRKTLLIENSDLVKKKQWFMK